MTELTMSTIENVIADAILILFADIGHVTPHVVDIVKELVAVIPFVFLTTQFTHARYLEERYHLYFRFQHNLQKSHKHK